MRKKFCFRKVTSLLIAMVCVIAMSSISVCAADKHVDKSVAETKSVRTRYQNEFKLTSNNDSCTCELTRQMTAYSTYKRYSVTKLGSDCTVIVKFVNQNDSSKRYTLALTANGGTYRDQSGVTIPRGTYTVSFASVPCTVLDCWCVFQF